MKAFIVHEGGRCAIEEIPRPSYGEYEALVRICFPKILEKGPIQKTLQKE